MKFRQNQTFKQFCAIFALFLGIIWAVPVHAQGLLQVKGGGFFNLPTPGSMVTLSPTYDPMLMAGMTINPQNPLNIDFIILDCKFFEG